MSVTTSLRIYTAAFPGITVNSLKYVVYDEADDTVEITSQTFAAPHPARAVSFDGLSRINYLFRLLEMNGSTVVREKGRFNVVPDDNDVKYKEPVQLLVDVTTGFTHGTTVATLDGTAGTEDWRGYEMYPERLGVGTMKRGIDYTWNKNTGVWTLITTGDTFQANEYFICSFGIVIQSASGVARQKFYNGFQIITAATVLTAGDAGKKFLINGASDTFDITLPDIDLVEPLVPFFFEGGVGSHKTVRIKCNGSQMIDWRHGAATNLKIGICESIELYKQPGTSTWRVGNPFGNFLTVGRQIFTDMDLSGEFNVAELKGDSVNVTAFLRFYEDYVQLLPPSQVCSYAAWTTGNNKYKFSYSSGGVFRLADRRGLYYRNSDGIILPGVYQADSVGQIEFEVRDGAGGSSTGTLLNTGFSGQDNPASWLDNDPTGPGSEKYIRVKGGPAAETRPKTVVIKIYALT